MVEEYEDFICSAYYENTLRVFLLWGTTQKILCVSKALNLNLLNYTRPSKVISDGYVQNVISQTQLNGQKNVSRYCPFKFHRKMDRDL